MSDAADDPRPVVRCIVAWWPVKTATPILRPRGTDVPRTDITPRSVFDGAMTLEVAASFAELGFEVMVDPFDLEALTRWEQLQRTRKKPWHRLG